MPLNTKVPSMLYLMPLLLLSALLGGCGGGGGGGGEGGGGGGGGESAAERSMPLADPVVPEPLLVIEGDPARINAVPDIVALETLADSGLQVAYTSAAQRERVDPLHIGAQWQYMQECVGIVAPAPLVIVIEGAVEPLVATDDVIRDLDGRVTASASGGPDGVATIQVDEADFDGSLGNPGFALRSIMGRHLWLSAMLAERDYPYLCARTAAT